MGQMERWNGWAGKEVGLERWMVRQTEMNKWRDEQMNEEMGRDG